MHKVVDLSAARAVRLAQAIAASGSLDQATAGLAGSLTLNWSQEGSDLLTDLQREQARREEEADPSLKAARLIRAARDLEARAIPLWAEGAEWAGKAAGRLQRGEIALAAAFQRKTEACEGLAAERDAEAFRLKLQAAEIMASLETLEPLKAALAAMCGAA